MNIDKPHDETDSLLPRYAKVHPHLAARLSAEVLQRLLDPNSTGMADPTVVEAIEEAGSLDINIGLYHHKSGGVVVLENAAAKLAETIAADAMLVFVARNNPSLIGFDVEPLARLCRQRTATLLAACDIIPVRPPLPAVIKGWCIVELMGQKRYSAHVEQIQIGGQMFFRLEIPTDKEKPEVRAVKIIGAHRNIYAMTPCDERIAMSIAYKNHPMPIETWEMDGVGLVDSAQEVHPGQKDGGDDDAFEDTDGPNSEDPRAPHIDVEKNETPTDDIEF